MADELGLHARLTGDSTSYVQAIDRARDALVDLQQQSRILKQGERDITKAIEENTKKYGENSVQVKRCKTDLEDNMKAQMEVKDQVKRVNAELQKLKKEYTTAAEAAAKDTKAVNENSQAFETNANRIKSAFSMIKGLAVGYAGKQLFNALIGSNADFEQSMTSFEVLLQSAEKAQTQMEKLEQFGAETPFELADVTESTKQLLAFGVAEEDVMTRLQQLGDLSQGKAELLDRITLAYGKMQAKGKVSLEELNMMTEAGVPILRQLAEEYDVTQEALFKMITAGEVNIDGINKAMESMTSEGGQFYGMMEKQSQTMSGLWSTFMDNISMVARQAGEEGFGELKGELEGLLDMVNELAENGTGEKVGRGVATIISAVSDLIGLLWDMRGVLVTIGAGWAGFTVLTSLSKTVTGVTTAVKLLSAAAKEKNLVETAGNIIAKETVILRNTETGAVTLATAAEAKKMLATEGATVAQVKLNTAMLASPYTWIAAAIAAVTVSLIALSSAQQSASEKVKEAVEAHEEAENELQAVQSELDETAKKIDDLNGKGTLTLTDEAELEQLEAENDALLAKLVLLREEAEIKGREANKEIDEKYEKSYYTHESADGTIETISDAEHLDEVIQKYNELKAMGAARTEQQEEELEELRAYITEAGKRYQQDADGYTAYDEQTQQTKEHLQEMADAAANALDPQRMQEMAEEVTNAASAAESLSALSESLSDIQSKIELLQEAQENYNETGYISADMFQKLTENDLLSYLDFANGKLTINTDALYNGAQSAKEKATADVQASLASQILAIVQEDAKAATDDAGNALQAAKTDAEDFDEAARNAATGAAILAGGMAAVYEAYSGNIGEGGLSADAQAKINSAIASAQSTIGAINKLSVKPSKSSSGSQKTSSSNTAAKSAEREAEKAAQEAEKKRKERVSAYKDNIEEMERLDERYEKLQKGYGNYTDNDSLFALGERAKRYRQYAEEVLSVDYMTQEEQFELYQKYAEKAEDLELEYFQTVRERDEKCVEEMYDKRLETSEDWVDYQKLLNAMSVDDEIAAGQRIVDAAKTVYQEVMNDARLSAEFREDMLEKLDDVIQDYTENEIKLNRQKWDDIISDMESATDQIIAMYEKMEQASEKWISEQKGRDNLSTAEEIDAYDRRIARWDEAVENGRKKYEETIDALEKHRTELMASGNYTDNSPEIKKLDKQLKEEREKLENYLDDMNWQLGELKNARYNLYKEFLEQQVQDFIDAEREKVNAHYDALKEMEDQDDRDKKRRELEEQIKQYEGAVTKEGREKLKDLLEQLEDLDKEERQIQLDKQQQEELDALDLLEEGMLEQAVLKAQLVFDDDQIADEIKKLIAQSDTLAKEFADNFTEPFEDYFKNKLPQQIKDAFEMPDISWMQNVLDTIGGYGSSVVDSHNDNSKHVTYDVTVHTHSNADLKAILKAGG